MQQFNLEQHYLVVWDGKWQIILYPAEMTEKIYVNKVDSEIYANGYPLTVNTVIASKILVTARLPPYHRRMIMNNPQQKSLHWVIAMQNLSVLFCRVCANFLLFFWSSSIYTLWVSGLNALENSDQNSIEKTEFHLDWIKTK